MNEASAVLREGVQLVEQAAACLERQMSDEMDPAKRMAMNFQPDFGGIEWDSASGSV
jgi:hypothetical protein